MRSSSWALDPKTGDYKMDATGRPVQDETLLTPAYIRLKGHRQGWLYAPDDQWGSDYWRVKRKHGSKEASDLEAVSSRALSPMINDGRAKTITVTTTQRSRPGLLQQIQILDIQGQPTQFTFDPIG